MNRILPGTYIPLFGVDVGIEGLSGIADELLLAGLEAYFGGVIYGTAVVLELTLVTEGRELIDLAASCAVRLPEVCSWRELCRSA